MWRGMVHTPHADARTFESEQAWHLGSRVRRLRLFSGLVLFVYVFTHLLNHALCNASVSTADAMRQAAGEELDHLDWCAIRI